MQLSRLRAQRFGQLDQHYASSAKAAWMPTVDISERKDAYVVAVEVPGVGIDDLEITFQDGLLTIQGERHNAHDSSEERVHRVERRYGPFLRSITLPGHVMADAIEALDPGRRAAHPGTQGAGSPRQTHPGPRQPAPGRPGTRRRRPAVRPVPNRGRSTAWTVTSGGGW